MTYQWQFLNLTTPGSPMPMPREQHASAAVQGHLYIFGGKSRTYPSGKDTIYNDLWRLNVPHSEIVRLDWQLASGTDRLIPEDKRVFLKMNSSVGLPGARLGMCIEKVNVFVTVSHACVNQLRMSLLGPGRNSFNFESPSSSFEVLLFNQRSPLGLGCLQGSRSFEFDDLAGRRTFDDLESFDGHFRPDGRLSQFIGAPAIAEWTLAVEDMKSDGLAGSVVSWTLQVNYF